MHKVAWWLVIIGAINWGLVGVAQLDVVELIFGTGSLTMLVYILVGLSGLYLLWDSMMGKGKK